MRDIIQKLLALNNIKERNKLLEKFREYQFKGDRKEVEQVLFEIFKYAKQILENTENNEEKRIALRVLGAIFIIYPSGWLGEMLEKKQRETPVNDGDIMDIIDICLELLENEDGNLRLSSAYLIDHLRSYMPNYNYIDLFYNLLSLKDSPKNQNKNSKTIEFCIDKIFSPHLEEILEIYCSPEIKRMKITVHSKNEFSLKMAEMVEKTSNQLISETEKYLKTIFTLRGEYLLNDNFIPYIENIGILQIAYELQRLKELHENNKLETDEMKVYLKMRLLPLIENRLKMLENLESMEEFSVILLNTQGIMKITNLKEAYNLLETSKRTIEKIN
jgi:hypothetical protein